MQLKQCDRERVRQQLLQHLLWENSRPSDQQDVVITVGCCHSETWWSGVAEAAADWYARRVCVSSGAHKHTHTLVSPIVFIFCSVCTHTSPRIHGLGDDRGRGYDIVHKETESSQEKNHGFQCLWARSCHLFGGLNIYRQLFSPPWWCYWILKVYAKKARSDANDDSFTSQPPAENDCTTTLINPFSAHSLSPTKNNLLNA